MKNQVNFLLQKALDNFQTGNLSQTKVLLSNILKVHPKNFDALHLMGVVLGIENQHEDALKYLTEALKIDPNNNYVNFNLAKALSESGNDLAAIKYHEAAIKLAPNHAEAKLNFGKSLLQIKHFEQAATIYMKAIELNPDLFEAWLGSAVAFRFLMRFDEALHNHDIAIKLKPNFAEAWSNKGITLSEMRQYADAMNHFEQAISLKPNCAETWSNKGVTQHALKKYHSALNDFNQAILLNPELTQAISNKGLTLHELGLYDEAISQYNQAIQLKPNFAEAWFNLGQTLHTLMRFEDALIHYDKAILFNPNYPEAWSGKGLTLYKLNKHVDALFHFDKAIELKPKYPEAWSNRGVILTSMGSINLADQSHRKAIEIDPNYLTAHNNLLFNLNYFQTINLEQHLKDAKFYGEIVSKSSIPKFTSWKFNTNFNKLRVGFVSGDFRTHSVGHFLEGLIKNLDYTKFEIFSFPTINIEDELTRRIQPFFKEWISIYSKSDIEAATLINQQNIDILIDLSGHSANNRLPVFSFKPAPLQISWLGYPVTSGLPEIDYILGDPYALSNDYKNQFTENIWQLPKSYLCLTPPQTNILKTDSPALKNGFVTFGSFNNISKINSKVIHTWSSILKTVDNSKLLIKTKELDDLNIKAKILEYFYSNGINSSRLILKGKIKSKKQHFEEYNNIDIALDTFPYPGVTTSSEALWMGVPVIFLKGTTFLSSTANSIAFNSGTTQFTSSNPEEYIQKAVKLASDVKLLNNVRKSIRDSINESTLFDAHSFAKNFGITLENLWHHHLNEKTQTK